MKIFHAYIDPEKDQNSQNQLSQMMILLESITIIKHHVFKVQSVYFLVNYIQQIFYIVAKEILITQK